jgi:D-3-phosphoglycerate dehydrogenase
MYKIKLLNKISPFGINRLDRAKYIVSDDVENPEAILVRSAKMHGYNFEDNLLAIARAGAGTNNIPVADCAERGIVVFNTPGANADAVKELALAALLLSSRDILSGIDWVKTQAGLGDAVAANVETEKAKFVGPELGGKKLGVIGLGAIGAKIANDAVHLGMEVYGYDPYLSVDGAWSLRANIHHARDLATIYHNCDYITIHVPYTDATHEFINRDAIAQMKDGVNILNLARAELVSDDDILAGIAAGKVHRYVTDFPNGKTAGVPGIIAIPHLGASTPESEDKCAVMAADQLADYIENGNIINSVNMPRAVMERAPGTKRVCLFHQNVPDMISKTTHVLSSRGLNIENMFNTAIKGYELAYSMIDFSGEGDGVLTELRELEGVLLARIV